MSDTSDLNQMTALDELKLKLNWRDKWLGRAAGLAWQYYEETGDKRFIELQDYCCAGLSEPLNDWALAKEVE